MDQLRAYRERAGLRLCQVTATTTTQPPPVAAEEIGDCAAAEPALVVGVTVPLLPGKVEVRATGYSELLEVVGNPYRVYFFVISVAGVAEQVSFRFRALRNAHQTLAPAVRFPSRHVLRDMNKESNARRRSVELQWYLRQLLNDADARSCGFVATSPRLHQALGCSPALAGALAAQGNARRVALQQRAQVEAAHLAAVRQQQLADRDVAQGARFMGPGAALQFPRQLSFELLCDVFGHDQVSVKGPGGLVWFDMRPTSTSFPLDTQVIADTSGRPLLALYHQVRDRDLSQECRLERVAEGVAPTPLCVITRHRQIFAGATPTCDVRVLGGSASSGGGVSCHGRWGEDFVLMQGGALACRVRRRQWSLPECYDVIVEPGRDVLLFLGVACAIDHIRGMISRE